MDSSEDVVRNFWMDRAARKDFLWRDLVDINFRILLPLLRPRMSVLDLGAGDGRLTKKVAERVAHVKAVDYTQAVLRLSGSNISTEVCDIRQYEDREKYDLVILFGVMNFVEDAESFYRHCRGFLVEDGKLVVKHQCGRRETVRVSTKVDGVPYLSTYRFLGEELAALFSAGFTKVDAATPYPPEMNPWRNTVYCSFVGAK